MMKSALRCSMTPSHHMDDCSMLSLDDHDSLHSRTAYHMHDHSLSEHSSSSSSTSSLSMKPPQLKSNVSFGKVDVRVYERVVEDCTYLGIGWQYNKDVTASAPVDAFEQERDGHRRTQDELRLSAGERRRIAVAYGCEQQQENKKASRPMALSMI